MHREIQVRRAGRGATRRAVLGGVAGALAGTALWSPALGQDASPDATAGDGAWSFTDDKGVTVSLSERPMRIVADVSAAAPLWDFGIRPVAVFGWNATETGDFGDAGGHVDPAAVEVVGNATETVQLEALAAVQPDLIVTLTWAPDEPREYWSIDEAVLDRVVQIAPLVAIAGTGEADVNTERFAELAASLGADLQTPELVEAKARYETALADFAVVATEKSDLANLFIYVDAGQLIYVANPPDWADLTLYQRLGLQAVKPEVEALAYWEELSLEQALKYPADVLFNSTRPGTLTGDELTAHPVLGQHPAVLAGQVGAWNQDFIMSYQGMADALEGIGAVLRGAGKVT
jgi:iron complex transport system substrate-binding protein